MIAVHIAWSPLHETTSLRGSFRHRIGIEPPRTRGDKKAERTNTLTKCKVREKVKAQLVLTPQCLAIRKRGKSYDCCLARQQFGGLVGVLELLRFLFITFTVILEIHDNRFSAEALDDATAVCKNKARLIRSKRCWTGANVLGPLEQEKSIKN